jgi:hypothetical protein
MTEYLEETESGSEMNAEIEQLILRYKKGIAYRMKVATAVTSLGAEPPPSPVTLLLAKVAGASTRKAMRDRKNPWKMARTAHPITVFRLNREKLLPSAYEEEAVWAARSEQPLVVPLLLLTHGRCRIKAHIGTNATAFTAVIAAPSYLQT